MDHLYLYKNYETNIGSIKSDYSMNDVFDILDILELVNGTEVSVCRVFISGLEILETWYYDGWGWSKNYF